MLPHHMDRNSNWEATMSVEFLPRPVYAVVGAIGSAFAALLAWAAITPEGVNAWLGCMVMTIFTACYSADIIYRYARRWKAMRGRPVSEDEAPDLFRDLKSR
jgi:hypothetical protein